MTLKEILELFPTADVVAGDIIHNDGGKRTIIGRLTKGVVLSTPEGEELMAEAAATRVVASGTEQELAAEPEPVAASKPATAPKPTTAPKPAVAKPGVPKLADHLG